MTKAFAKEFDKIAPALTELTQIARSSSRPWRVSGPTVVRRRVLGDQGQRPGVRRPGAPDRLVQGADGVRQPDHGVDGQDRRRLARHQHPRAVVPTRAAVRCDCRSRDNVHTLRSCPPLASTQCLAAPFLRRNAGNSHEKPNRLPHAAGFVKTRPCFRCVGGLH